MLGLAVFEHRGMAAWLRVGKYLTSTASHSVGRVAVPVLSGADDLVGVLSAMALAVLR